jgi:hypothetical protein
MARYRGFDVLTHNIDPDSGDPTLLIVNRTSQSLVLSLATEDASKYPHPGGCQAVGDFLVLPAETEHGNEGVLYFYYLGAMTDGDKPTLLPVRIARGSRGAGAAGMTMTGRAVNPFYLAAAYDAQDVTIYRSNGLPLSDAGCQFFEQFTARLEGRGADNLCLVSDVEDRVFLFAFTSTGGKEGIDKDWVGLHRVLLDEARFELIEERQMYTKLGSIPTLVHFRFGAGLRVLSPSRLEFYCSGRNAVAKLLPINRFSVPA